ncbi:C6 zinc cluster transcription factor-like protein [Sporothrix eucalyptigena]
MSLEYIYITRHGFRSNWVVNPATGDYTGFVRSPTGHPADPALTSHGVTQSRELAAHLARRADEPGPGDHPIPVPVERIYSSPYYRCLQTIQPFVEMASEGKSQQGSVNVNGSQPGSRPWWAVRCDPGLVDWFGPAPFEQPQPAPLSLLHDKFFPWIDLGYAGSGIVPLRNGESMAQLHARVAATLAHIIRQCDADGVRAIVLCAHAATIIAMGRVLTGVVPDDVETEDFGAFTCGLTTFRRRTPRQRQEPLPQQPHQQRNASPSLLGRGHVPSWVPSWDDPFHTLAGEAWISGRGIGGGWTCEANCDCSFLSEGEERGWRFSGDDEAFAGVASPLPPAASTKMDDARRSKRPIVDAGLELGVVVEGVGRGHQQGRDSRQSRRQRSADRTLAQPEPLKPLQGARHGGGDGGGESVESVKSVDDSSSSSDTSAGIDGGDNKRHVGRGGRKSCGGEDQGSGGGRGGRDGGGGYTRL